MRDNGGVRTRRHQPDYILIFTVFVLLAIGLVLMYSISPVLSHKLLGTTDRNYYFYGQLLNITVGVAAWVAAAILPYQRWRTLAPYLIIAAAVCLLALMIPGLTFTKNGATRWLKLGPASFQPAELLKLAFIVYLAGWFEQRGNQIRNLSEGIAPFAIMLAAVAGIVVVFQRDMGTAMVVVFASLGMLFVAGAKLRHFASIVGAGAALGWAAIITFPHRMERLAVFLNPAQDPNGAGYHITQALIAIGTGGLLGLGLGHSIQIYGYLPEAANDSIFAILAEEFGLIGSVVVVGLFGMVAYRGMQIARNAPDSFGRLLATGISLWILFQAAINIAAMLSLVPLTGIPLPFISYGGSSLVFTLVGVGILQNISSQTTNEVRDANSRQRRGFGWAYLAGTRHNRSAKVAR